MDRSLQLLSLKNQSLLARARTILQSILHFDLAPTTAISNHMKKGAIYAVTEFSNWNQTCITTSESWMRRCRTSMDGRHSPVLLSTSIALPFGWKNKSQNNYFQLKSFQMIMKKLISASGKKGKITQISSIPNRTVYLPYQEILAKV